MANERLNEYAAQRRDIGICDLNKITEGGRYRYINKTANSPNEYGGVLDVYVYDNRWIYQVCITVENTATDSPNIWLRRRNPDFIWGEWYKLYNHTS